MRQVLKEYSVKVPKDSRYKEEYAVMLLNHRSRGKSFASFGGVVGVGIRTITSWIDDHEGFKEAFEISESTAIGFWEDIAMEQAIGYVKGSSTTLLAMLKNQFPDYYKEKSEVEHNVGVVFKIDTGIPSPRAIEVVGAEIPLIESRDEDLI